jgi:hypothetical protein
MPPETEVETKNDQKPINREQLIVKATPTKGVTMKPVTPQTEQIPSTQLRKVVFGGSLKSQSQ